VTFGLRMISRRRSASAARVAPLPVVAPEWQASSSTITGRTG